MRQAPHPQVEGDDEPRQRVKGSLGIQAVRFALVLMQFGQRMLRAGTGYECAAVHVCLRFAWLTAPL